MKHLKLLPLAILIWACSTSEDPTPDDQSSDPDSEVPLPTGEGPNLIYIHQTDPRLMRIEDVKGREMIYHGLRDTLGIPVQITHLEYYLEQKEKPTFFFYDAEDRLTSIESALGHQVLFEYLGNELSLTFKDPNGESETVIVPFKGQNQRSQRQAQTSTPYLTYKAGIAWGLEYSDVRFPVTSTQTRAVMTLVDEDQPSAPYQLEIKGINSGQNTDDGYRIYHYPIPWEAARQFQNSEIRLIIDQTCVMTQQQTKSYSAYLPALTQACNLLGKKPLAYIGCELFFKIVELYEDSRTSSQDFQQQIEEACTTYERLAYEVVEVALYSNTGQDVGMDGRVFTYLTPDELRKWGNEPQAYLLHQLVNPKPKIRNLTFEWTCKSCPQNPTPGLQGFKTTVWTDEVTRYMMAEAETYRVTIYYRFTGDTGYKTLEVGQEFIHPTPEGLNINLCAAFSGTEMDLNYVLEIDFVRTTRKSDEYLVENVNTGC